MADQDAQDADLAALWGYALNGDRRGLEQRLVAGSRLPGPRANLELAHRLADCAGATPASRRPDAVVLLSAWLAPAEGGATVPDPHAEYLAAVAALAAGALLAADADPRATGLLTAAAQDARWRVRELAATGLQRVLAADWRRGLALARTWLDGDALLARAAAAGVAEPPLLRDPAHAADACRIVECAVDALLATPAPQRRATEPRVLRQALGYAVSVVAAADPASGVPLLERLATAEDPDARWIARENLKKARLAPLADRLAVARDALSRP